MRDLFVKSTERILSLALVFCQVLKRLLTLSHDSLSDLFAPGNEVDFERLRAPIRSAPAFR